MSAAELEGFEGLVAELRANPPVAPDRLRERVLAGSGRRRPTGRRLALLVVPVAVALAVVAALVHGFVSSGSQRGFAAHPLSPPVHGSKGLVAGRALKREAPVPKGATVATGGTATGGTPLYGA